MEIRRFFINQNDFDGKTAVISGDEFLHATKVLRQKLGFTIIFCIGDGYDYYAEIVSIEKTFLTAKFIKKEKNNTSTTHKIILYQGLLKGSKNDFVVQKAVELGISEICFFESKYTVETNVNIERLKRISIEASKQCGRSDIADIKFTNFNEIVNNNKNAISILFYEKEHQNKLDMLNCKNISNAALIIGSEGGFDESEVLLAKSNNVQIMTLGTRILRAETASIVATTLVMHKLGEI